MLLLVACDLIRVVAELITVGGHKNRSRLISSEQETRNKHETVRERKRTNATLFSVISSFISLQFIITHMHPVQGSKRRYLWLSVMPLLSLLRSGFDLILACCLLKEKSWFNCFFFLNLTWQIGIDVTAELAVEPQASKEARITTETILSLTF